MSEENTSIKTAPKRKKINLKTVIFDTDFILDPKVQLLLEDFGPAGLAMFVQAVCTLARDGGRTSELELSIAGRPIGVTRADFANFLKRCVELKLLGLENGEFFSIRLLNDAANVASRRDTWRKYKGSKGGQQDSTRNQQEESAFRGDSEEEEEPEHEPEPESEFNSGGAGGAESKPPKPKRAQKLYGHREGTQLYGEFNRVWLTGDEYSRLCLEHGAEHVNRKLQSLDASIENGNRKYRAFENHYATLSNWFRLDAELNKPRAGPRLSDFDLAAKRELERGVKKGLVSQEDFNKWCAERSI